jgi:hypothetical protein
VAHHDGGGSLSRADLISQEWVREQGRKESLEKRGITAITTSGVLVTLIFAFASAVAKGHHFGTFTLPEKILLGIALLVFVVSAAFGVATNTPRNYGVLSIKLLAGDPNEPHTPDAPVSKDVLEALVEALQVARERNDTKAIALTAAIALQTVAFFIVGVTIVVVII